MDQWKAGCVLIIAEFSINGAHKFSLNIRYLLSCTMIFKNNILIILAKQHCKAKGSLETVLKTKVDSEIGLRRGPLRYTRFINYVQYVPKKLND
jgi:hypothetical protein